MCVNELPIAFDVGMNEHRLGIADTPGGAMTSCQRRSSRNDGNREYSNGPCFTHLNSPAHA